MEGNDLFSDGQWTRAQQELGLSPRQAQIVRLILEGNADKQIAQRLNISMTTVRTHLHRLFEKFTINDRLELTLLVLTSLRGRLGKHPVEPFSDGSDPVPSQDAGMVLDDPPDEYGQGQSSHDDVMP